MITGIYCIENNTNHKKYVGQSVDIKSRWKKHKTDSRVRDTFLYRAFKKYGIENFSFYILEECLQEQLDEREIYWIDALDTYNHGYNMTLGGTGTQGLKNTFKNELPKNFNSFVEGIDDIVPIVKLDTDYEIIEYYVSVSECARANNIESTNVSKSALGKHKTCNGYIYMYYEDIKDMTTDEIISYRESQRKKYNFFSDRENSKRKVLCNGVTYDSIAQAATELGLDPSSISKVCRGRLKQTHGYKFKYIKEKRRKNMNKQEFITKVAGETGFTKKDTGAMVDAFVKVVTDALAEGDDVKLSNFGTFTTSERNARECRNPRTGEKVLVDAKRVPKFKANKALKEALL